MISFVADKLWKDMFWGDKFCSDKFSEDMFCMGSDNLSKYTNKK